MASIPAPVLDRLREVLATRRPASWPAGGRRPAAVLVPLFVREGEVHVVLTRKSMRLRSHRGQVSFPGGGFDPADGTLERTALREAEEEAGIRPEDVEVLGALDDLPTASSDYVVRPFVGIVPHPYRFVPDGFEVERIITPPLGVFADPARCREQVWERGGQRVTLRFYDVEGEVVWGVTERILRNLLRVIEDEAR